MRRTDREVTARAEIDAIIRGSLVCRVAMAKERALNEIMRQYSGKDWALDAAAVAAARIWQIEITSMTGKQSVSKTTAQP